MRRIALALCLLLGLAPSYAQRVPPSTRLGHTTSTSSSLTHETPHLPGLCSTEGRPDDQGHFVSRDDLVHSYVSGDDLLAPVGRAAGASLPADYAPTDLVNLATGAAASPEVCEPPGGQCLRRDAADAYTTLVAAMRAATHDEAHVHSAFRAYTAQCGVFRKWAYEDGRGFCSAAEQSALAGHSQHQLGTTLDLFTRAWASHGPVFRNGFGCTPAGRWLAEHAWEHGFVLPYVLSPDSRSHIDGCWARNDIPEGIDPRTGYRAEPWHLRFIGRDNARRFHDALHASGVGTSGELTVDGWLRHERGRQGDPNVPVCDGCACGACTTQSVTERDTPCGEQALRLDVHGDPVATSMRPEIVEVRVARRRAESALNVEVLMDIAPDTLTQGPTMNLEGLGYVTGASYASLTLVPHGTAHHFDDLNGAWRVGAEPLGASERALGSVGFPYRVGLGDPTATVAFNGANVYLPAQRGRRWVRFVVAPPADATALRVALLRDGGRAVSPVVLELPTQGPPRRTRSTR